MSIFSKTKISFKIAGLVILLGMTSAAITAGLTYNKSKASLVVESESRLEAVLANRKIGLEEFLSSIEKSLETEVQNPGVKAALVEFEKAWAELPPEKTSYLQDQYITRNPHPTGNKDELDAAQDGTSYSAVHAKYHPYFRTLLRDRGYYDIFLFDNSGTSYAL